MAPADQGVIAATLVERVDERVVLQVRSLDDQCELMSRHLRLLALPLVRAALHRATDLLAVVPGTAGVDQIET